MGILTVVSNAMGLKENVVDGKTGWIVPKRAYTTCRKIESISMEKVKTEFV